MISLTVNGKTQQVERAVARQQPPAAEGVDHRGGAAVRLLPVRADYVGGSAARQEQNPIGWGYRQGDVGQYLPLRYLQPHP
jgi:hypothetical protein